jgi:hypothetical protein
VIIMNRVALESGRELRELRRRLRRRKQAAERKVARRTTKRSVDRRETRSPLPRRISASAQGMTEHQPCTRPGSRPRSPCKRRKHIRSSSQVSS